METAWIAFGISIGSSPVFGSRPRSSLAARSNYQCRQRSMDGSAVKAAARICLLDDLHSTAPSCREA